MGCFLDLGGDHAEGMCDDGRSAGPKLTPSLALPAGAIFYTSVGSRKGWLRAVGRSEQCRLLVYLE